MKKPKKSGIDYCNHKGFFSLVLLALDDTEYRFLLIDCGSSGSCSDAQIFNRSNLREKIEDSSLGLWHLNPWVIEGHICTTCWVMKPLMPWMVEPYSRRQLTREERIASYRISRGRRMVENAFGILVSQFRVLEQRPRVVKRHCVFIYGVA